MRSIRSSLPGSLPGPLQSARGAAVALAVGLTLGLVAGFALSSRAVAQSPFTVPEPSMDSVFLVGHTSERGTLEIVGTAWTIAPSTLATAAHVAIALRDARSLGARIVARHGLLDRREIVIGDISVHPAYDAWSRRLERMLVRQQNELKNFSAVPVADVALLEVVAGDAGSPLTCVDVLATQAEPELGSPVAYLGYPTENLSGFAVLHLTPCSITALTDYFFQRCPWSEALLLHLSGVATGGASGSPVLNPAGRVLGILSAAENVTVSAGLWEARRIPIGYAYAQRIDLAQELLAGDATRVQELRNVAWSRRAAQVFLPPHELLDQIMEQYSPSPTDLGELVLDSEHTVAGSDSLRVPLVLEPGYFYQACAFAHDGTDIDAALFDAQGASLDEDTFADQYPLIEAGPLPEEQRASLRVWAAEDLLGPTTVSLRVVRHVAEEAPESDDPEDLYDAVLGITPVLEEQILLTEAGEQNREFTFELREEESYAVLAVSAEDRDIDLEVYIDDTFYDADRAFDARPIVGIEGIAGTMRILVVFPSDTAIGDTATLRVYVTTETGAPE